MPVTAGREKCLMTINTEDLLNSIMESLDRVEYIKADEIPGVAMQGQGSVEPA